MNFFICLTFMEIIPMELPELLMVEVLYKIEFNFPMTQDFTFIIRNTFITMLFSLFNVSSNVLVEFCLYTFIFILCRKIDVAIFCVGGRMFRACVTRGAE